MGHLTHPTGGNDPSERRINRRWRRRRCLPLQGALPARVWNRSAIAMAVSTSARQRRRACRLVDDITPWREFQMSGNFARRYRCIPRLRSHVRRGGRDAPIQSLHSPLGGCPEPRLLPSRRRGYAPNHTRPGAALQRPGNNDSPRPAHDRVWSDGMSLLYSRPAIPIALVANRLMRAYLAHAVLYCSIH